MERPYWKHEEEAHEAMDITADEVVEHVMELFSNASFLCFAHGNINQAQVLQNPFYPLGYFVMRSLQLALLYGNMCIAYSTQAIETTDRRYVHVYVSIHPESIYPMLSTHAMFMHVSTIYVYRFRSTPS